MRTAVLTAACAAALAAGPAFAATARATAEARVVDPGSVRMLWPMAMPSVQGSVSGASFMGSTPSMGMANAPWMWNQNVTVQREEAESAGVTAPGGFALMPSQEREALLLRTSVGGGSAQLQGGALLGGQLVGDTAASIDAAAGGAGAPGRMLVVVVQYN